MDNNQTPSNPNRRAFGLNMEIVIAIFVSMLAVAAIIGSRKFPGTGLSTDIGSGRFPLIYACALIVLSIILAFQNLRKSKHAPVPEEVNVDPDAETPSYLRAFIGVVATGVYMGSVSFIGYALPTGIYLSFLMALLGMRHKVWNPLLALTITVVMYFTFSAGLNVPLPVGSLFE